MLAVTDPYKVLQVDPDAEREVIRAAYRTLALKYHPDVSALPADQLILIADYGHARRFVDQAFAECGPSPKPHPQRSETFVQY